MRRLGWVLMVLVAAICAPPGSAQTAALDGYVRTIKPLFERRCYACHGALEQKAQLRLDTVQLMRQGGQSGPVIEPGHGDESLLLDRVSESDAALRMPPEGEPLKPAEIAVLRAWIDAGSPAPPDETPQVDPAAHWAFRPPVRPIPPDSSPSAAHPVDAFLEANMARTGQGITPAPAADRATLLRRLALDLSGLAPSRAEQAEFLADRSPLAVTRAIDRLLASPRTAERWARHWMDIWRYSDWYGFGAEVRNSQPHLWRWRDWIVDSLAQDRPYSRMIQEMLAGDELAPGDPETLRATGYLARSWHRYNRTVWLHDTVDHMGKAFLGMTLECAKCHDHKYDPIKQKEYYALRAFFEPLDVRSDRVPGQPDTAKNALVRVFDAKPAEPTYRFERGDDRKPDQSRVIAPGLPSLFAAQLPPIAPVPLDPAARYPGLRDFERAESRAAAENRAREAGQRLNEARVRWDQARRASVAASAAADAAERIRLQSDLDHAEFAVRVAELDDTAAAAELAATGARLDADAARFARPPDPRAAEIAAIQAGMAHRQAALLRARHAAAAARLALDSARRERKPDQEIVPLQNQLAQAQDALKKLEADPQLRSLARDYPSFGPVHPDHSTGRRLALARWITDRGNPLAARVAVNHVWTRLMGRPLVESVFDFGLRAPVPEQAELLDFLAVEFMDSGWSLRHLLRLILSSQAYQRTSDPACLPPDAELSTARAAYALATPRRVEAEVVRDNVLHLSGGLVEIRGGPELDHEQLLAIPRRSLYFRHAPEKQAEFLKLFDAANPAACYRREVAIIPQQALALANSTLSLEASRRLAAALARAIPERSQDFVDAAFEQILGRLPTELERGLCLRFLSDQRAAFANPEGGTPFREGPQTAIPPAADPAQRAREGLIHVLWNHHDFITIR